MIRYHKSFLSVFHKLAVHRHAWEVWSDFINLTASAISNRVDLVRFDEREVVYMKIARKYESRELDGFRNLFHIIVDSLEANPRQDFLGEIFQRLNLSSHWNGQFFTPYNVCELMVAVQTNDVASRIKQKGYVTVSDPACGAGALLIAFANNVLSRGINYQRSCLFVGQDIDRTAALMCYIQLSLLGCPGYVIIGDTISRPGPHPENDIWYTPMYFSEVWKYRHLLQMAGVVCQLPDPASGSDWPMKEVI